MSRIILICGTFPIYDNHGHSTAEKEFVASHGIDEDTGKNVVVQCEHPTKLGAIFDNKLGEWVIPNKGV